MSLRPNSVSQTPRSLDVQDPREDVLADVLGVTLLRNALYKRIEGRAPWGLKVPTRPRALFYLLARGAALLEVAGERAITLSAGDVAFIPNGTAHTLRDSKTTVPVMACDGVPRPNSSPRRIGGTGPASSIIAGFFERDSGRAPALLERLPKVVVLSPSGPTPDPSLAAIIQLVLAESASPGPASALVLQRLADVLLVHALRSFARRTGCPKGLPALSDPAVHQALSLMHAQVDAPWTVVELAKRVGLSRSGFAARFTELVGEPPLQYLARWRISRAAELLRDTTDSVVEVATRVGYESVPSFSRAFKRWRSVSPAAFRRATKLSDETELRERL